MRSYPPLAARLQTRGPIRRKVGVEIALATLANFYQLENSCSPFNVVPHPLCMRGLRDASALRRLGGFSCFAARLTRAPTNALVLAYEQTVPNLTTARGLATASLVCQSQTPPTFTKKHLPVES